MKTKIHIWKLQTIYSKEIEDLERAVDNDYTCKCLEKFGMFKHNTYCSLFNGARAGS